MRNERRRTETGEGGKKERGETGTEGSETGAMVGRRRGVMTSDKKTDCKA